ncbi:uncharacterized protein LOC143887412 [Tasmannia lanceolata]|uniref:uncharacterized protein LOC143887412 n=1 Tax=Tasmannia lanceolata TaxID=3420 RepID=UPI0040646906
MSDYSGSSCGLGSESDYVDESADILGGGEVVGDDVHEEEDVVGACAEEDIPDNHLRSNACEDEEDEYYLRSPISSSDEREPKIEFNEHVDMEKLLLAVGMIFSSHKVFRAALKEYAIQHGSDYMYVKNEPSRVTAECKSKCGWRIHASHMQQGEGFQIKTFNSIHKCPRSYNNHHVSSTWLSSKYLEKIRDDPKWNVHAIRKSIKRDFKVDLPKSKIYRAKRKALECIEGGYVEQYARIWDYCDLVMVKNPGSCLKLKVERPTLDVLPTFQRLYISLHAMRSGFLAGCRPFIGLDGCHLKGPWGGQILSAVGKDANDHMFPIAYAIVEAELKESWTWFLTTLLNDIGQMETHGWTFISDRQKGLVETFEDILPNADHRFCVRHMYSNFKAEFKGKILKDTMWTAAYTSTLIEFQNSKG